MIFQRILCPLDVHDPDIAAVQAAVDMCEKHGGVLYMLYIIEDFAGAALSEQFSFFQNPSSAEYQAIRKTIVRLLSHHVPASITAIPVIRRGNVPHGIVDEACQKQVDLIVLTRKKRSVVEEMLFHSVIGAVIRTAPCPVIIIRRGPEKNPVKQSAAFEQLWMDE